MEVEEKQVYSVVKYVNKMMLMILRALSLPLNRRVPLEFAHLHEQNHLWFESAGQLGIPLRFNWLCVGIAWIYNRV